MVAMLVGVWVWVWVGHHGSGVTELATITFLCGIFG